MAGEREIGILINLRNNTSKELRKIERDLGLFRRNLTSTFSMARTTMMGIWSGAIFGGLLQSSKELNKEWMQFRENVMAAGPTDSLRVLGGSIADLVTGLKDSNTQAKSLGENIATIIDTISLVPIGLQGILDRLRQTGGMLKGWIARDAAAVFQLISADAAESIDLYADEYEYAVDKARAEEGAGLSPAAILARRREERQNQLDAERSHSGGLQQKIIPIEKEMAALRKRLAEEEKARNEAIAQRKIMMEEKYQSLLSKQLLIQDEINKKYAEQDQLIADVYHTAHDYYSVIANEVLQAYDDLIEGKVKPLDQYMKDIVASWGRMAAQAAMETAFQVGAKAVASVLIGGGGITSGGVLPSYADGTIIHGPQRAVIGDNPERMEAVIPMRNRKVPVEITGGGGGQSTVFNLHISGADPDGIKRLFFNNREALQVALMQLAKENPSLMGRG